MHYAFDYVIAILKALAVVGGSVVALSALAAIRAWTRTERGPVWLALVWSAILLISSIAAAVIVDFTFYLQQTLPTILVAFAACGASLTALVVTQHRGALVFACYIALAVYYAAYSWGCSGWPEPDKAELVAWSMITGPATFLNIGGVAAMAVAGIVRQSREAI